MNLAARTASLSAAAMLAFAANSLLCRPALGQGLIDAASFTSVRIVSGAVTLLLIVTLRRGGVRLQMPDWRTAALFAYMIGFSFAYLSLSAGTGALILFGAVQLTMFVVALRQGERFAFASWAGLALAVGGLVYLVSPGVTAPDPTGAVLMAAAGIAWGVYSLLGKATHDPLEATALAFIYSVPPALIVSLFFLPDLHLTGGGLALALASGALASGCGYVVWYAALAGLTAGQAAIVQLSVPAIAAFGGVTLLGEPITLRLLLATAAILGGITVVLARRAAGAP